MPTQLAGLRDGEAAAAAVADAADHVVIARADAPRVACAPPRLAFAPAVTPDPPPIFAPTLAVLPTLALALRPPLELPPMLALIPPTLTSRARAEIEERTSASTVARQLFRIRGSLPIRCKEPASPASLCRLPQFEYRKRVAITKSEIVRYGILIDLKDKVVSILSVVPRLYLTRVKKNEILMSSFGFYEVELKGMIRRCRHAPGASGRGGARGA